MDTNNTQDALDPNSPDRYIDLMCLHADDGRYIYLVEDQAAQVNCIRKEYVLSDSKERRWAQRELRILRDYGDLECVPTLYGYWSTEVLNPLSPLNRETHLNIVMELFDGHNLEEILSHRSGGRLPAAEGEKLLRAVIEALCELHGRGVIQGDLSLRNTILRTDGKIGFVDFENARVVGGGTYREDYQFTAHYAPFEQIMNLPLPVNVRADYYAVGAITYKLLTGEDPIMATEREEGTELRPPRDMVPNVPPKLENAIMWMLGLYPKDRPSTMHAVLTMLNHPSTGDPIAQTIRVSPSTPSPVRNQRAPSVARVAVPCGAIATSDDRARIQRGTHEHRRRQWFEMYWWSPLAWLTVVIWLYFGPGKLSDYRTQVRKFTGNAHGVDERFRWLNSCVISMLVWFPPPIGVLALDRLARTYQRDLPLQLGSLLIMILVLVILSNILSILAGLRSSNMQAVVILVMMLPACAMSTYIGFLLSQFTLPSLAFCGLFGGAMTSAIAVFRYGWVKLTWSVSLVRLVTLSAVGIAGGLLLWWALGFHRLIEIIRIHPEWWQPDATGPTVQRIMALVHLNDPGNFLRFIAGFLMLLIASSVHTASRDLEFGIQRKQHDNMLVGSLALVSCAAAMVLTAAYYLAPRVFSLAIG